MLSKGNETNTKNETVIIEEPINIQQPEKMTKSQQPNGMPVINQPKEDKSSSKVKSLRIWIGILIAFLLIAITVSSIWIYTMYDTLNSSTDSIDDKKTEIEDLEDENENLEEKVEKLEKNIANIRKENNALNADIKELEEKADWFDTSCKIVIADEGSLYKTYHTYDCEKWNGCSLWIYNKEQVINDSDYTECTLCN